MNLSDQQIKMIAEELSTGMVVYIHKTEHTIIPMLDFEHPDAEEHRELWQEILDPIEQNPDDYFVLRQMSSRDSFYIMEKFTLQLNNQYVQNRLITALNKRKPFRNFRNVLDYYGDVEDEWYKFKDKAEQEWTHNALKWLVECEYGDEEEALED